MHVYIYSIYPFHSFSAGTVVCMLYMLDILVLLFNCIYCNSHWSCHRNAKAKVNQPKKKLMPKPPQACPGLAVQICTEWDFNLQVEGLDALDSIRLFLHPFTAQSFTFFIRSLHFFCFRFNTRSCSTCSDMCWSVLESSLLIFVCELHSSRSKVPHCAVLSNFVTRLPHRANFWTMEKTNTRFLSMSIGCPFSGPPDLILTWSIRSDSW